eukprot:2842090-Rhodomonas_salina.1
MARRQAAGEVAGRPLTPRCSRLGSAKASLSARNAAASFGSQFWDARLRVEVSEEAATALGHSSAPPDASAYRIARAAS